MHHVSIIIPTLNECESLAQTLRSLTVLDPAPSEIIIVDGGSSDQTVDIAKQISVDFPISMQILDCDRGRSIQMNKGAKQAIGETLCFLHADTSMPHDAIALMQQTLEDDSIACGGFISIMVGACKTRWGISLHNFLKTYYAPLIFRPYSFVKGLRLLFGDQVMFCRRNDFLECGGFDEALPIMEDGDLCLKLSKKGRIKLIDRIVQSSDRRVNRWGAWKATGIYLYIGILWGLGVSTSYLKRFYDDIR